ncbi:hypothetical protein BOX15_Mlig003709g1, partial [Macrostomum lignano]
CSSSSPAGQTKIAKLKCKMWNSVIIILYLSCVAAATADTQQSMLISDSDICQPKLPPDSIKPNSSAPTLLLQWHTWAWLENLTDPDWAPRTEQSYIRYDFVRPGSVFNWTLKLVTVENTTVVASLVTDGNTLCMSSRTLYMNISANGTTESSIGCTSLCFTNISSIGTAMDLPLLELNNDTNLQRSTEYLAVDSLDPEEQASYNCLGLLLNWPITDVPELRKPINHLCSRGSLCLIAFNGIRFHAGCNTNFNYGYCNSNWTVCDFQNNRYCPICCRGNKCNMDIAEELYLIYGGANYSRASSTIVLTTALGLLLGTALKTNI